MLTTAANPESIYSIEPDLPHAGQGFTRYLQKLEPVFA
jgi:hypothetical protein